MSAIKKEIITSEHKRWLFRKVTVTELKTKIKRILTVYQLEYKVTQSFLPIHAGTNVTGNMPKPEIYVSQLYSNWAGHARKTPRNIQKRGDRLNCTSRCPAINYRIISSMVNCVKTMRYDNPLKRVQGS